MAHDFEKKGGGTPLRCLGPLPRRRPLVPWTFAPADRCAMLPAAFILLPFIAA